MINNLTLVGRLTREAELKYTHSGTAVATFNLAVERPYQKAQGKKETDFINCVVWKGTAEALSNYTSKGSLIGLTGRIQTRSYENNEGRKVYVTEVIAENIKFLEPKRTNQSHSDTKQGNYTGKDETAPEEVFEDDSNVDTSDDDLPF